jgi:hypothetical protein
MKSHYRLMFFSVMAVLACLAGTWWYLVKQTEWQARRLLVQAVRLQVGASPVGDVLELARHFPGQKYGFGPCIAGSDGCIGTIYVANTWLSQWDLARTSTFGARFVVTNNRLTDREFLMESYNAFRPDTPSFVFVREEISAPGGLTFKAYRESSGIGVNMTADVAEEMRNAVYNFNFGCLAKIGGCLTDEEMLPVVKKKDFVDPDWVKRYEQAAIVARLERNGENDVKRFGDSSLRGRTPR